MIPSSMAILTSLSLGLLLVMPGTCGLPRTQARHITKAENGWPFAGVFPACEGLVLTQPVYTKIIIGNSTVEYVVNPRACDIFLPGFH